MENQQSEPDSSHPRRVLLSAKIGKSRAQIEFASTIKADPVGALFDGEHPASVTVTASENKLEDPKQRIHRS
jgi:hypothetical protein